METILFGSIVLHAEKQTPAFDIPELAGIPRKIGQHVRGRYNGTWIETNSVEHKDLYLPQRFKRLGLSISGDSEIQSLLMIGLEALDSMHEGARQLYKLNMLLEDVKKSSSKSFSAVVNVTSTSTKEDPASGAFYLMSSGLPIYMALVFDTVDNSTQLVWSTIDFKTNTQKRNMFRYVFFPMPIILNRPIFLPTHTLCAKWWKLTRGFGAGKYSLMKASNALELLIFKDPKVANYGEVRG
jgi:hypothetical protein